MLFVVTSTPAASSHHPAKSCPSRPASGSAPYASPMAYAFVAVAHVPPLGSNVTLCVP